MTPAIFGLSGLALTPDERAFFADADPAGFILFKRNVDDREQLRALTDSLRSLSGRNDVPILIDQEGGRVARMQPPIWPEFPRGERFDALYEIAPMSAIEAMSANAQAIALTLAEVGINVDCLPLLDVRQPGSHDVIGDRALGSEPMRVSALGRATIEGLRSGGVVGVVKHIPGHGRSMVDSHQALPVVDADVDALEIDLEPFIRLKDAPMAMTAHVVYTAWDADRCATLSPVVIDEIIRKRIGFDGLLMSDDIDMKALSGTPAEKALGAIRAGCDVVLDCWGRMDEMIAVAAALPGMTAKARARLDAAMATVGKPEGGFDELVMKRDALLAHA